MGLYKDALKKEMEKLCENPKVIFLGQQVGAEDFYGTLKDIPPERRLEMPVAEELQMGMSIGLALEGFIPISIYQRMDFLPRACDQLVNHLDLIKELSKGKFNPKIIIRTTIGVSGPLDIGLQHKKNLIDGFRKLLRHINVVDLRSPLEIPRAYKYAVEDYEYSSILVEHQDLYGE